MEEVRLRPAPRGVRIALLCAFLFIVTHALWRFPLQQILSAAGLGEHAGMMADRIYFLLCCAGYLFGAILSEKPRRRKLLLGPAGETLASHRLTHAASIMGLALLWMTTVAGIDIDTMPISVQGQAALAILFAGLLTVFWVALPWMYRYSGKACDGPPARTE
ncbi:hypothetical protein [Paracoccus siganidrum]|uniref:Uncharacterized protein n=1 Tax=Paracoccus siganidrum TaxID=1276757 RepID=A0A419AAN2_9RHOB|nr:hypothetical protein [Paracoccus siganidrum]RJL20133.1 hypothetical protein D3P05_03980 [Paracoccus siganidrum]RMC32560.1 hypothetical protein C9E82_14675 [Paracoccus siganidrum]